MTMPRWTDSQIATGPWGKHHPRKAPFLDVLAKAKEESAYGRFAGTFRNILSAYLASVQLPSR